MGTRLGFPYDLLIDNFRYRTAGCRLCGDVSIRTVIFKNEPRCSLVIIEQCEISLCALSVIYRGERHSNGRLNSPARSQLFAIIFNADMMTSRLDAITDPNPSRMNHAHSVAAW